MSAASTEAAAPALGENAVFAELLAATIEPQEASEADAAHESVFPMPLSLPDLWLGFLTPAASDVESVEAAEDEDDAPIEYAADDAFSDAAPAAAESAVAVPIIVQVPTDIMSAAPAAAVPADAGQPAASNVEAVRTEIGATDAAPAPEVPAEERTESVAAEGKTEPAPRIESRTTNEHPKADIAAAGGHRPTRESRVASEPARTTAEAEIQAVIQEAEPTAVARPAAARPVDVTRPAAPAAAPAAAAVSDAQPAAVAPEADVAMPRVDAAVAPEPIAASERPDTVGAVRATKPSATAAAALRAFERQRPQGEAPAADAPTVPQQNQAAPPAPMQVIAAAAAPEPTVRRDDAASIGSTIAIVDEVAGTQTMDQSGDLPSQDNAGQQPAQGAPRDVAPAARAAEVTAAPPAMAAHVTQSAPAAVHAVEQAESALQAFTPAQTAENVSRMIESMRVQWRQGVPEATVRLNPEHLGEVTISIRVDRGAVTATVHAETPEVQQWLETQQDRLRSGLADQGLSLERFVVSRDRQQQREQRQQQGPRYRMPAEPQGQRFEITV
jgi:flagellar hook-length control protein FliK